MRTTIDLPDPLFREAKTRAIQSGVTFKELVAQYIEAGLRGRNAAIDPRSRGEVPLPIFRTTEGPPLPPKSNAELFAVLEREETGPIQP